MQFSDPNLPPIFNAIFDAHFGGSFERLIGRVAQVQDQAFCEYEYPWGTVRAASGRRGLQSPVGYQRFICADAEKTFRAVKRQAEQLKRTIGEDAYNELLWNTERL